MAAGHPGVDSARSADEVQRTDGRGRRQQHSSGSDSEYRTAASAGTKSTADDSITVSGIGNNNAPMAYRNFRTTWDRRPFASREHGSVERCEFTSRRTFAP